MGEEDDAREVMAGEAGRSPDALYGKARTLPLLAYGKRPEGFEQGGHMISHFNRLLLAAMLGRDFPKLGGVTRQKQGFRLRSDGDDPHEK